LLITVTIIAVVFFSWPEKQLEITKLKELNGDVAIGAIAAVKNVYEVSLLSNDAKLKKVMIPMIDAMGFREFQGLLENIKSPAFDKAKVFNPSFNTGIYIVLVPEADGKNSIYQFTMRKKDGSLLLESICLRDNGMKI